eukprot:COSAG06_NODE_568_length_14183_cov_130.573843_15_plen_126_part_00
MRLGLALAGLFGECQCHSHRTQPLLSVFRVDRSNFLPRFWPTAAAVAERGWAAKTVTSIDDFRRRLHAVSCELQARGLPSSPPIFAGSFFHANGTVCENSKGGVSVMSPAAPGCLPRFSSCADHE